MSKNPTIFCYGSKWLRADFHLHTRKDKQFKYDGPENDFVNSYVAALQEASIRVGVIANHNKFNNEEFQAIESELEKVNRNHSALQIECKYKGDKKASLSFMKEMFRGSNIRENTLRKFVEGYADFGAIYKDFEEAKEIAGNSSTVFEKYFNDNLVDLLTWQPPNQFVIKYREKELKQHSLGQRASALILFVLSQQENDVIIIDQPEDDLDNQTIYEDVIKLLRKMKPQMQFIFATHNANLPVLGDAEQVFACTYSDDAVDVECGSIDCPNMQQKIVDIMEGGKEAFKRRKEIYEIWKPRIC